MIAVALAGVVASFLLFNWFPARVFMGDAGSLALGSAIVALTAELHLIWFLPVLGIVFVVEAASVVVNVTAIRQFGRRVLRASPIHHHFEELGLARAAPRRLLRRRRRTRHRAHRALRARRGHGVVSEEPVVVIGAGRSGLACASTLAREGNRVILVDRSDSPAIRERIAGLPSSVEVRLGGYPDDVAADALMVCPSPGVPWDAPELEVARAHGVPVRSEMDLVFERCRARICGITGTNGKTTTTALVAAIFERAGERVHLGGNIGMTMLDRLDGVVDTDWVVLELSSFQIESVREPRCAIACVLNVTPDHLDRHGDFAAYAETKRRLVRFALDDAVLGFDDPITREMAAVTHCRVHEFGLQPGITDGATLSGSDVVSVERGVTTAVVPVADIPLFGEHNLQNVLAAVAVARAAGLEPSPIAGAVRDFTAVPTASRPFATRTACSG